MTEKTIAVTVHSREQSMSQDRTHHRNLTAEELASIILLGAQSISVHGNDSAIKYLSIGYAEKGIKGTIVVPFSCHDHYDMLVRAAVHMDDWLSHEYLVGLLRSFYMFRMGGLIESILVASATGKAWNDEGTADIAILEATARELPQTLATTRLLTSLGQHTLADLHTKSLRRTNRVRHLIVLALFALICLAIAA